MLLLHYPWQPFLPLFSPLSSLPPYLPHSFPAHPPSLSWGPLWLPIIHPIPSILQMICGLRSVQHCLQFMLMNGDLASHLDKYFKRCQRRCLTQTCGPVMDSSWMTLQAWMCYTKHVFSIPHFVYLSIHSTITVYVPRVLLSIAIFSDGLNSV